MRAAMAACYAPDAHFTDPVFDLHGAQVGAMWAMLCERGKDLTLDWRDVRADDNDGQRALGAHVHVLRERPSGAQPHRLGVHVQRGRIVRHVDTFDLWRWSRMALGAKGVLLGWTPLVRSAIRAQAKRGLDAWMERHPDAAPTQ